MLQVLQESLGELDKQLTTYLTDRVDAFQVPQEAQVLPWLGGCSSHKGSICNHLTCMGTSPARHSTQSQ